MSVNTDISDLFFNTDHEDARIKTGKDVGLYDPTTLRCEADMFLGSLHRLGIGPGPGCPTAAELVDDFLLRV